MWEELVDYAKEKIGSVRKFLDVQHAEEVVYGKAERKQKSSKQ